MHFEVLHVELPTMQRHHRHRWSDRRRVLVQMLVWLLLLVVGDFTESKRNHNNWGHSCCAYSMNPQCKKSCKKATSQDDVRAVCSANQDFYVLLCLDKQEIGRRCCPPGVSSDCFSACRAIFIQEVSPSQTAIRRVAEHCESEVATCVQNYTLSLPVKDLSDSLACCEEHGHSDTCKTKCREALNTQMTEDKVLDEVTRHCGDPNPSTPLWQCFLRHGSNYIRKHYEVGNSIYLTDRDNTQLMCCRKAVTLQCRNLCIKAFSRQHTETPDEFDKRCSYSLQEKELNICLEEVKSQCEPGCSGLSYCSNFNNRPELLYRSCNRQSDSGAEMAVKLWSSKIITIPSILNFEVPIKDISQCEPAKWRAIACTMYIKPCHRKSLSSFICRSDCLDVLSKCLDTSRLTDPSITAETICSRLSPQDNTVPCVSFSLYTAAGSSRSSERSRLVTPCNPNPCNGSQVCVVNWRNCSSRPSAGKCESFQCIPGCVLGEGSSQVIPLNASIRVPDTSDPDCYRLCQCGRNGFIVQCKRIGCVREEQCVMSSGMIQSHGSVFNRGCSRCACLSGEVTCSNRPCSATNAASRAEKSTIQKALPCGCPFEYVPVCGSNGQTYQSPCLASCAGLNASDIFLGGSCSSKYASPANGCSAGERSFAKRQKCLSVQSGNCRHTECVKVWRGCDKLDAPVCDTKGKSHPNVCQLTSSNKTLAYRGRCLPFCHGERSKVCGIDGDEYVSECAAWAAGVTVDYNGPCRTAGNYRDTGLETSVCLNVICLADRFRNCQPIIPPGGCCPICAGEIRLLMSRTLVESTAAALSKPPVTIADVLDALRLHIRVLYCEVFGYLSAEGDVVILVMPVLSDPTSLQIDACMRETERIGTLISSSNPTVTSYLALSIFLSADVRTCQINSVTAKSLRSSYPSKSNLCILLVGGFVAVWRTIT